MRDTIAREKLAINLQYLREKKKGVSLYRMAKDIKVSYGYLYKLEHGDGGNPSLEKYDQLASYLGVNVYELFI